jgi:hypothetical protein
MLRLATISRLFFCLLISSLAKSSVVADSLCRYLGDLASGCTNTTRADEYRCLVQFLVQWCVLYQCKKTNANKTNNSSYIYPAFDNRNTFHRNEERHKRLFTRKQSSLPNEWYIPLSNDNHDPLSFVVYQQVVERCPVVGVDIS